MQDLRAYLINLDASKQRLASAAAQLHEAGFEFERVPAVDGRGRRPETFPEYDERLAIRHNDHAMVGGEIGCYLSHVECAERFLATDAPVAVVFEDDFGFREGAPSVIRSLPQILSDVDPDWEIVNICHSPRKHVRPVRVFGQSTLVRAFYFPLSTQGVMWSRKGAQAFLETRESIYLPVDHLFRKLFCRRGTGYGFDPSLVAHMEVVSDINTRILSRKGETLPDAGRKPGFARVALNRITTQARNHGNAIKHRIRSRVLEGTVT